MTPTRKLVYDFFKLPYVIQLDVIAPYYEPGDDALSDAEMFIACFRRAKERDSITELRQRIDAAQQNLEKI